MDRDFLSALLEGTNQSFVTTQFAYQNEIEDGESGRKCLKKLKKSYRIRELSAQGRLEYFIEGVRIATRTPPQWVESSLRLSELSKMCLAATKICETSDFDEIQMILDEHYQESWIYSSSLSKSRATKALRQIARTKLFEIATLSSVESVITL